VRGTGTAAALTSRAGAGPCAGEESRWGGPHADVGQQTARKEPHSREGRVPGTGATREPVQASAGKKPEEADE